MEVAFLIGSKLFRDANINGLGLARTSCRVTFAVCVTDLFWADVITI